eukprot:3784987-Karenia_brevis.AAC.1
MASMIATWKDGDTYAIPDYLVEDARKKEAVKADTCKSSDNNVMYEVHSVTNTAYKLHWRKDKTMLLAISAGKYQKCQVPLNWFEESDKGKELCVKVMSQLFTDFISDKFNESQLFDMRDKILGDHGVKVHARGKFKRKTLEKAE